MSEAKQKSAEVKANKNRYVETIRSRQHDPNISLGSSKTNSRQGELSLNCHSQLTWNYLIDIRFRLAIGKAYLHFYSKLKPMLKQIELKFKKKNGF